MMSPNAWMARRGPAPNTSTTPARGIANSALLVDVGTQRVLRREQPQDWDITPRLADIVVPTLVVSGEHDEITPSEIRPRVDALRDVRWELVDDARHCVHVEQPARFLDLVEQFLPHDRDTERYDECCARRRDDRRRSSAISRHAALAPRRPRRWQPRRRGVMSAED